MPIEIGTFEFRQDGVGIGGKMAVCSVTDQEGPMDVGY